MGAEGCSRIWSFAGDVPETSPIETAEAETAPAADPPEAAAAETQPEPQAEPQPEPEAEPEAEPARPPEDLPEGWQDRYLAAEKKVLRLMADIEALLTRNRVFIDRCNDVGVIGPDEAKAWGFTGPCLRASGVDYDVRKHAPYLVYDRLDFEVPIGHKGDNYDRYLVRLEEIRQSVRILRQVIRDIPEIGRAHV